MKARDILLSEAALNNLVNGLGGMLSEETSRDLRRACYIMSEVRVYASVVQHAEGAGMPTAKAEARVRLHNCLEGKQG